MIFELAVSIARSIVSAYAVGKQWLLVSVCLGMKFIDIGTASGLKRGLCKAFSTQVVLCGSTSMYKRKR